jgi:hypothetical protein
MQAESDLLPQCKAKGDAINEKVPVAVQQKLPR